MLCGIVAQLCSNNTLPLWKAFISRDEVRKLARPEHMKANSCTQTLAKPRIGRSMLKLHCSRNLLPRHTAHSTGSQEREEYIKHLSMTEVGLEVPSRRKER